MSRKFIIIDGSSLIHRAFYALPLLTNSQGRYTNAAYGFCMMLIKLLEDEQPDCVVVALDKGRQTFRTELYGQYKGQRKATPPELSEQFPLVRDILQTMDIPVYEQAGYEADDLIGVLATIVERNGDDLLIVTGDRDAFQLISPSVKVLLTRKGITELERFDETALYAKYQLSPKQMIDLKGLMGDASDNIPGLPGVGEKTALKLLYQFGSVENVLAHADEVSGNKLRETIKQHGDLARLSKRLATIVRDLPLELDDQRCRLSISWDKVRLLFAELDFKSLLSRLPNQPPAESGQAMMTTVAIPEVYRFTDETAVTEFAQSICRCQQCAFALNIGDGPAMTADLRGIVLSDGDRTGYIETNGPGWQTILNIFSNTDVAKVTFRSKPAYILLWRLGCVLNRVEVDTEIAAYLLEPTTASYEVCSLVHHYLPNEPVPAVPDKNTTERDRLSYLAWSCSIQLQLAVKLQQQLEQYGMMPLFYDVEMPLVEVLANMEYNGVKVGAEPLNLMALETGRKISTLTGEIYQLAGEEFNINSTKQLGHILFEKLGLPTIKKTKTGYSTDAEVLEKLLGLHPLIEKLLEFRLLSKLKSTYLDGLNVLINPHTGRIHTTFNQTVTATGRLSSSDPNLQNIPIRTEIGRKIRALFVPGNRDWMMLSADYSQIELRIMAHLSGDDKLRDAFLQAEDIHRRTASEVFGVAPEQVTVEMRSRAKAVNFGIIYGISDYGLARDTGVSRKEAGQYIENYFARYPGVHDYMNNMVLFAREHGYVETLLHRRRYLPDIHNRNFNLRSFAERTAMNTPIQGSAADIMKKAMVEVYRQLTKRKLRSKLLLQVHDELVLEVPRDEMETVEQLVRHAMEHAVEVAVPLTVDVSIGANWAEAK